MACDFYPKLINDKFTIAPNNVRETKNSYNVLTERHLQAMWLEQKYFKTLVTSDGSQITILSPGIWNSEAGPDFLKAHLKIGEQDLRGDIELHLSQEGWMQHHHHQDTRYDNVILHVCYWLPVTEKPIMTSQNKPIISSFLQPQLTIPESRLLKLIDIDLYPYKIFSGSGRCSKLLFSKISKDKTLTLFRSAAFWRLEEKWSRLQSKIDNPEKYVIGGISIALGYKHNAEAFVSLFNAFEKSNHTSELFLLATMLGSCGFFESHFKEKWGDSPFYQSLLEHHSKHPEKTTPIPTLRLDHIRPANHPVRRLALLAKLLTDSETNTLEKRILLCWKDHWQGNHRHKWKIMKEQLMQTLPSYHDPYWECHYTFENKEQLQKISLMGKDSCHEILINVLLPFLFTHIRKYGTSEENRAFEEFYSYLPSAKTKKGEYLSHRFFGETQNKLTLLHADTQQGAYQIHRDFCVDFEASCQGCPFVERYFSEHPVRT